jgi:hypothetical protein
MEPRNVERVAESKTLVALGIDPGLADAPCDVRDQSKSLMSFLIHR